MLHYDRIGLSEGIDVAKRNNSKKCMVFHHRFFNHQLKFQDFVCNGCHNLMMLCLNISDIAIIAVKGVNCCCILHGIKKPEAIDLLENSAIDHREYI